MGPADAAMGFIWREQAMKIKIALAGNPNTGKTTASGAPIGNDVTCSLEVRQAIEMANIYSSIISGMMDAFASVISNNLNVIMKVLTSITVLLTVPNIIFGFYGMNITAGLPLDQFWWIPLILAVAVIAVVALMLKKHDLF